MQQKLDKATLEFKQIVAIIITVVTLSITAILYINNACAATLTQADKQFVPKSDFARIEENVENINLQLERIEKKIDRIIESKSK
jgi:ubiquinone biosynthesis protein UbiJ